MKTAREMCNPRQPPADYKTDSCDLGQRVALGVAHSARTKPQAFTRALNTYKTSGLLDLIRHKVAIAQGATEGDQDLLRKHGFQILDKRLRGAKSIGNAFSAIARHVKAGNAARECPVRAIIMLDSDYAVAKTAVERLRSEIRAAYDAISRGHLCGNQASRPLRFGTKLFRRCFLDARRGEVKRIRLGRDAAMLRARLSQRLISAQAATASYACSPRRTAESQAAFRTAALPARNIVIARQSVRTKRASRPPRRALRGNHALSTRVEERPRGFVTPFASRAA